MPRFAKRGMKHLIFSLSCERLQTIRTPPWVTHKPKVPRNLDECNGLESSYKQPIKRSRKDTRFAYKVIAKRVRNFNAGITLKSPLPTALPPKRAGFFLRIPDVVLTVGGF